MRSNDIGKITEPLTYSNNTLQIYGRRLLQKSHAYLKLDKLAICVRPSFGPASDAKQLTQVMVAVLSIA
jgi:hypothetical protein